MPGEWARGELRWRYLAVQNAAPPVEVCRTCDGTVYTIKGRHRPNVVCRECNGKGVRPAKSSGDLTVIRCMQILASVSNRTQVKPIQWHDSVSAESRDSCTRSESARSEAPDWLKWVASHGNYLTRSTVTSSWHTTPILLQTDLLVVLAAMWLPCEDPGRLRPSRPVDRDLFDAYTTLYGLHGNRALGMLAPNYSSLMET